jgi:carboxypeptidase D
VPAVSYVEQFSNIFRLNNTFMADLKKKAQGCGYYDYLTKYLTFPPPGPIPPPTGDDQCKGIWQTIKQAVSNINPCFNIYQITTTCPALWDVLGFPGSFEYLPAGAKIYFDRDDVKKAMNAPATKIPWAECKPVLLSYGDSSIPSSLSVLPRVIEKSERTIIGAGSLDFVIMPTGILLSIQNMTWNGAQGFQKPPIEEFIVPTHKQYSLSTISGSGVQGVAHTERGLTWVEIYLSGHMVPQYTPSSAYKHLEYLLGRIPNLNDNIPFTFQMTPAQPPANPLDTGEDTIIRR